MQLLLQILVLCCPSELSCIITQYLIRLHSDRKQHIKLFYKGVSSFIVLSQDSYIVDYINSSPLTAPHAKNVGHFQSTSTGVSRCSGQIVFV